MLCNRQQTQLMMKRLVKNLVLLAFALILFTGCYLKSVHPLVTEENAITLPGLEGRWETEDQRWTFIKNPNSFPDLDFSGLNFEGTVSFSADEGDTIDISDPFYLIILENLQSTDSDSSLFIGAVGEIAGYNYLDLSLLDISLNAGDSFSQAHLFPVHTFSKIKVENSELSIEFFKDSWIEGLIENNRVRIKHEKVDNDVLITASTKELQKFVEKYSDDENAFDDPLILTPPSDEL